MITTHIVETADEIIIGKLDCVIARFPKAMFREVDEALWHIEYLLKGLGQHVEVEVL